MNKHLIPDSGNDGQNLPDPKLEYHQRVVDEIEAQIKRLDDFLKERISTAGGEHYINTDTDPEYIRLWTQKATCEHILRIMNGEIENDTL